MVNLPIPGGQWGKYMGHLTPLWPVTNVVVLYRIIGLPTAGHPEQTAISSGCVKLGEKIFIEAFG